MLRQCAGIANFSTERGSHSVIFASRGLNERIQEREVDEPQAIIAAVAARNYRGTLCRIRMLREQPDDPI
jgi:hypothetical protein